MQIKTPQTFSNLKDISHNFSGILLDAYGVFWSGNAGGLFPGCKELMHDLVQDNKTVGILSNSTQLVAHELAKFEKHGLLPGKHFHFLITSGEVAKQIFMHEKLPFDIKHKKYCLFSEKHPRFSCPHLLFEQSLYKMTDNCAEADFIYISIPHINGEDQLDPEIFRSQLVELKRFNLPMICANPDQFAHEGLPPRPVVRQGSIAAIYKDLGGTVYYIGKPEQVVYDKAMLKFKEFGIFNPQDILMVGDTPETDILGANKYGMHSALITETGVMGERTAHNNLTDLIQEMPLENHPTYFLQKMA